MVPEKCRRPVRPDPVRTQTAESEPLTTEQRKWCDDYLKSWPNLTAVLRKTSLGTYRAASAHGFDDEEIHQAAWIGVIQQAKRFNPNHLVNGKPVQFASFAVWGIRNAVQTMMNFKSKSKTPQNGTKVVSGNAFIANRKGEPNEFFEIMADPKQLDNPLEEIDRIETLQKYVQDALGRLPARDRAIIEQRFNFDGENRAALRTVGNDFGISKERVRQIQNRVIKLLHKRLVHAIPLIDAG